MKQAKDPKMEEKKREYDDPAQSARFIELGEQLLEDDAEEKFGEAMTRILATKPTKPKKASRRSKKALEDT